MNGYDIDRAAEGARQYKLEGWGDGSAYRYHPCWVRRGPFIFINHWHVSRTGSIYLLTDPEASIQAGSHDSWGGGCPLPVPSSGETRCIFDRSKWRVEGPWQADAEAVLAGVLAEIAAAKRLADLRYKAKCFARDASCHARDDELRHSYAAGVPA